MTARSKKHPQPSKFTRSYDLTVNGRHIGPGTELSFRVERGRFRFLALVTNEETGAQWVDVACPKTRQVRSFHVTDIKRVHYKSKLRGR
jgi:hypothetical protein